MIKIFKQLAAGVVTVAVAAMPASARIQDSASPQASNPVGMPVPPPPPEFDLNDYNAAVLSAIAALDSPASATAPNAQIVREVIQKMDRKIAAASLPKRVAPTKKG